MSRKPRTFWDQEIEWLIASPIGRRILRRLFLDCGLFAGSFAPGAEGAMPYREGQRAVARPYWDWLVERAPTAIPLILAEPLEQSSDAEREGDDDDG